MEQRQWTPAISADASSPHRANRSISSYRQRPIAWADIEAAAEAGGYAIRTPSGSSALAINSSNSIDEDLASQKNEEGEVAAQTKSDREEEAEEAEKETKGNATEVEARGEDTSSSSKSIDPSPPTLDSLSIAATDEEGANGSSSSSKAKKSSRREKKPNKKDKKKARPGPFSPPASPSSSSDLVPTSTTSSSGKKDKKSKRDREKEKQEKERKELMVRVSVPERRMVRMVVFPVDTTVQGALEQLFMRNPLADDPGLYGLALAVDPSFGNPFASTYASSSTSSSVYLSTSPLADASLASAAAPYTPPARWLDSQQLLSSYTIRPVRISRRWLCRVVSCR
jgi:hypothetical protein